MIRDIQKAYRVAQKAMMMGKVALYVRILARIADLENKLTRNVVPALK